MRNEKYLRWIKFLTILTTILALGFSLGIIFDILGLRFQVIVWAVDHDLPVWFIYFISGWWIL